MFNRAVKLQRLWVWSWREIRRGKLWPITIALSLIIGCVFALSALSIRLEQVVVKQGKEALTADLVFSSANPIPEALREATKGNNLTSAIQIRYRTMAFSQEQMQLVTVRAVSENYPLRGELRLEGQKGMFDRVQPGELWLDGRVMAALDVKVGDTVSVGDADFTVSGRVIQEPGVSFNPFQQMPAVYINQNDVVKTGALQQGSRVRYQWYINGSTSELTSLKQSINLTPSDRWIDEQSPSRRQGIFERTTQYLSLTAVIVIMMAATTLVLTCQHYVSTRTQTVAMLKSLGASKWWLKQWLLIQVCFLLLLGSLIGFSVGMGLEWLLRLPLAGLLPTPLPSYGSGPFVAALLTCISIGIPALGIPLTKLINTSAVAVLQPQDNSFSMSLSQWTMLSVPLLGLGMFYANNALVWAILAGILALLFVLGTMGIFLSKLLAKIPLGVAMKLAVSRINRSRFVSGLQFAALGLSLMLLALIWLVRTDLLADWQRALPDGAPNVFAINIAPYERDNYLLMLEQADIAHSLTYPITRGRVSEINGVDAKSAPGIDPQDDVFRREINFTYLEQLPQSNQLISGQWGQSGGVSVEEEVAKAMAVKVGDKLSFVINGQQVDATVNSIRSVEWREMKPNFYFIFTPDVLSELPVTWMLSYRIDQDQESILNQLTRQFPTVSTLDIRQLATNLEAILTQIIWSITVLAALGLAAGTLLIVTLMRLSLSQRKNEIRLYRTLGSSKKSLSLTLWSEYGLLAIIASSVAALGAELSVALVLGIGFDVEPRLHPLLWVVLPSVTMLLLALTLQSSIKQLLVPLTTKK
ncbi:MULTISPECIES: ABC transporter permease [unclassified Vibrio]|uniref:FtsX-like permease family protein n=1 Tax=Vibrio sp. HB236076 TaxID=3232307 RepID=A0AB39HFN6_9VIBR|nr:FtsX-like permease family protein [Vibrio sp. HB161653]MDP5254975.1 ABC transporter permease [Vibrio sp. HB161653]